MSLCNRGGHHGSNSTSIRRRVTHQFALTANESMAASPRQQEAGETCRNRWQQVW